MLRLLPRRARSALVAGAALASATVMLAAPQAGAASDVPFTDDHVKRVFVAGSDTTYFVMQDLAQIYNESEGCRLEPVAMPMTAEANTCDDHTHPAGAAQAGVNVFENYDHDVIVNYFPQGSNDGRRLLCLQTHLADFNPDVPTVHAARSSSIPNPATSDPNCNRTADGGQAHDNGVFRFIAFAKDGTSWVAWEDTADDADANDAGQGVVDPVTPNSLNLTQANLKDIFVNCPNKGHGTWPDGTTQIQWWSDYIPGAPDEPIRVFTAIPGSGTRSSWDGFVGGNSENCIPTDVNPDPNVVSNCRDRDPADGCARVVREHFVDEVEEADTIGDTDAADEGESIYYLSVGRWHADAPAGAKGNSQIQKVNGIAATPATVTDGAFPNIRNMYNVVRAGGSGNHGPVASSATLRFLGSNAGANQSWLCRPLNGHSKPLGDPGLGIEDPNASINYANAIKKAYDDNGFIPLTAAPDANRCAVTNIPVDYLSSHDGAQFDHPDDANT